MATIITILILLNVIYIGAIVWCVRTSRKTNPVRRSKRVAKIVPMKMDEMLSLELDEKMPFNYKDAIAKSSFS